MPDYKGRRIRQGPDYRASTVLTLPSERVGLEPSEQVGVRFQLLWPTSQFEIVGVTCFLRHGESRPAGQPVYDIITGGGEAAAEFVVAEGRGLVARPRRRASPRSQTTRSRDRMLRSRTFSFD
ncbi:hypothetical protein EVAR_92691_1 [Eumeta japonica]|uniref:Uncharacterized protein n=1 Tax=Eumeta variegata TaxID=151549 RepID=A0A4C1SXV4_EUMVA|nr:hypothetical protein EVAR_92691_1 [Eumeta japonica]